MADEGKKAVVIPEDVHRQVKIQAAKEGKSIGEFLADLIRTLLGQEDKKEK